jgi:hypothetical protein
MRWSQRWILIGIYATRETVGSYEINCSLRGDRNWHHHLKLIDFAKLCDEGTRS